jgi:hypothetical protein
VVFRPASHSLRREYTWVIGLSRTNKERITKDSSQGYSFFFMKEEITAQQIDIIMKLKELPEKEKDALVLKFIKYLVNL